MIIKYNFQILTILSLIFLIFFKKVNTGKENNFNKYYFTMYPSENNQNPYIIYANTPFSEQLKIDFSEGNKENMIKKTPTPDYTISNISSIFFYEKEYMVKTCFGPKKIVEIIPRTEFDSKNDNSDSNYIVLSENSDISNNFVYCYSTIIKNPDKSISDSKAIITYWVEFNSQKEYIHKCILFYLNTKQFSQIYSLISRPPFNASTKYPTHCTTFREKDIFCSYYDSDLNNQFVIETNKIISNSKSQPSIFFVISDFGQINGNNMKPIALNRQIKSLLGGYYDVFLSEFHNNFIKEKNSTVLLYSLYRKSFHASVVPMFANLELFFGTNIRDAYVEINLFNYILVQNEIILFFIYKNHLRVARVDYSIENNLFKNFNEIQNLGYFSAKLENCKIPKYMQSTYITNLIKYNSSEQLIVNENKKNHYLYQQDIAILLSCSNSDSEDNENIIYNPQLIEMPQCLNYLDSINGNSIHKINFFYSISIIYYDIYKDPRLKSLRNVGIMFYPYEKYYVGLLFLQIKLKSEDKYIVPKNNVIYNDITHIRFQRIIPRYVPIFRKPFLLKYRLFNIENTNENIINNLSSNICYFQIKFFPYDLNYNGSTDETIIIDNSDSTLIINNIPNIPEPEEEEICTISNCAICEENKNNLINSKYICKVCDNELNIIIKDDNIESETYGQCICNVNLHFLKDPIESTCACQEDYAYYKSTNLCWPEEKLINGPYYIEAIDDITEIPIYNDCYSSCKKCSESGNEKNNNCLECKEGFAYVDEDTSNCIDKDKLTEGYHEIEPGHFIECHENCISCIDKPIFDENNNVIKQFCTECRNSVPYFLRDNPDNEYFNCFEKKCDENNLMFYNSEKSHECIKNCDNGVKPYNNSAVCLKECNIDFPYLETSTKKCYTSCQLNDINNKISNVDKGICTNECDENNLTPDNKCYECEKGFYINKNGICANIPRQCLIVDKNSGLCKICNNGFYPLKQDLNKDYYNCYENIDEIIKETNKSNFYLNETEKYWDECYYSCESCNAYGSENRQKCKKCKKNYHFDYYSENKIYNNCRLNLIPSENCTSTQVDMYKYKDFCHLCKEGYSFVSGTDVCMKTEELENGAFYKIKINIKTGDYRTEEKEVTIYYPCYKYCKTCKDKGDIYDNKCTSCINGFIFNYNNKKCIDILYNSNTIINSVPLISSNIETDKYSENDKYTESDKYSDGDKYSESDKYLESDRYSDSDKNTESNKYLDSDKYTDNEDSSDKYDDNDKYSDINKYSESDKIIINDSDENIWFKLGDDSFYIYKENNCLTIFYETKIFLVSNKIDCINICPKWDKYNCHLKKYERFTNMTREEYDNLVDNSYEYDKIKENVNIMLSVPEKNLYFHLTNYISPPPINLSYIDLSEYENKIKQKYDSNLLLFKVDIKRNDTQSTQVEYQFYNPNLISEKINLIKFLSQRRLDNDNNENSNENTENNLIKLKIDLPVNWTDEQIEKINYLNSKNIDAFNTSSEFYLDNCNQFTSSKGNDVFLKERKKIYYPDIPLCENNCTFIRYNSENQKVTCQCDYKENNDNYQNVKFLKNDVDKNFLKNLLLENLQSMKCIKVIFKWENLKKNAGFIFMIVFIIIFTISFVLYYISAGFLKIKNYMNEAIEDKNLIDIIKNKGTTNGGGKKKPSIKTIPEPPKLPEPKRVDIINISNGPYKEGYPNDSSFTKQNGKSNDGSENEDDKSKGLKKSRFPKDPFNPNQNVNDNDKNKIKNDKLDDSKEKKDKKLEGGLYPHPEDDKRSEGQKKRSYSKDSLFDTNQNVNGYGKYKINNDKLKNSKGKNGKNSKGGSNLLPYPEDDMISEGQKKRSYSKDSLFDTNQNVNDYGKNKIKNNDLNKNKNKKNKKDFISGGPSEIGDDNSSNITIIKKNKKQNNNQNEGIIPINKSLISENKKDEIEDEISMNNNIMSFGNEKNNNQNNNKSDNINNQKLISDTNNSINDNLNINKNININDSLRSKEINIIDDLKSDTSIIISDANEKKPNDEDKKFSDKKEENKNFKRSDSKETDFDAVNKRKGENYANDSQIIKDSDSQTGNENIDDLISNYSKPNPPPKDKKGKKGKKGKREQNLFDNPEDNNENENENENEKNKNKKLILIDEKKEKNKVIAYDIADENHLSSKSELKEKNKRRESNDLSNDKNNYFKKLFNKMNKADLNNLEINDELLSLEEFSEKYKNFPSIYIADLKKHHILYFTFCCDNNNIFLKLSFFSLVVNLYFGLNTMLIFDSNMSDAYSDKSKAKPGYILMNLVIPFIICGLIAFFVKIAIMPQYCMNKMIKVIQNNDKMKEIIGLNNEEMINKSNLKENSGKKRRDRDIKNKKKDKNIGNNMELKKLIESKDYQNEKNSISEELSLINSIYNKKVIIYFVISFIVLGLNWYMMTSFCAIFKNTGTKLIVNSIISLVASFIFPLILGLIPTGLGFLAIKIKNKSNEILYKIYRIINNLL